MAGRRLQGGAYREREEEEKGGMTSPVWFRALSMEIPVQEVQAWDGPCHYTSHVILLATCMVNARRPLPGVSPELVAWEDLAYS